MVCKGRLYGQEKLGGAEGRMTFRCHVARAAVAGDDAFRRSDSMYLQFQCLTPQTSPACGIQ